jgi:GTPase SAR1 family protein
MKIDEMYVKVEFWDTAGQERFRSILRTYYKKALEGGVVLVYDIGNRKSFEHLDDWIREICEKGNFVRNYPSDGNADNNKNSSSKHNSNGIEQQKQNANGNELQGPPFILVGNKNDIEPEKRQVTYEEGEEFAKSRNMLFYEVSALNGTNVVESLQSVVKVLYSNALTFGIARSSIQVNNEKLLREAEERRRAKVLINCGGCGK